jgi:hypothetical protein
MVDRTDSFLREVDEDVRRDQLLKLWETYKIVIVAGVAALFAAVIGYQWWQSSRLAAQERIGARYEAASLLASEGKGDEALKAFTEIAQSAPAGYQALARLRVAGEHAQAGRVAEALAAYEAIAKEGSAEDLLRDFAALQAAVLRLEQADWTEMKNRLTSLVDDSRPWHAAARETLGIAAYKAGQTEEAIKLFEQILGDRASASGQVKRAQEMLTLLTDSSAAKSGDAGKAAPVKTAPDDAKGDAAAKKK